MKRLLTALLPALTAVTLAAMPAAAAEQVTVERESKLHAEPRLDAPQVALAKQGTLGEVVGKSGAWLNVKIPEATGWLFSFNVRFNVKPSPTAEPGSGGGASALGRLFGPRRSVAVTSTIGVRGLEEEDLKQARFDAEQMRQLDEYAASKETAEQRARASGLAPVRVDYLEAKPQ
ncbi:MAG: hypothetical protein HYU76_12085 [Betaproteobacteria bacterium]|nr:hypothetical protein [Betaproteobacteria bacterium]